MVLRYFRFSPHRRKNYVKTNTLNTKQMFRIITEKRKNYVKTNTLNTKQMFGIITEKNTVCGYLILYTHTACSSFLEFYYHLTTIQSLFARTVYSPSSLLETRKAEKSFNGGERLRCDRVESCGSLSMFREEPAAANFRVKIR